MIRRILLLAALAAGPASAQEDSVYTRYDWKDDCDVIDASPPEGPGAWANLVCPGPGDTLLMLADGDARISMDYATRQQFGPWQSFRSFNHVHTAVEWRREPEGGTMVPFATIHRWIVEGHSATRELLVISTVARRPGEESCMVGYVDTTNTPDANRLARGVADRFAREFDCADDVPRGFGRVDLDTPAPARVNRRGGADQ